MVFVGGIVVDSFGYIAAGCVEGDLVFSIVYFTASSLLIYGAEDMEELADAFCFGVAGSGVHFGESYLGKSGGGGEGSREAEGAHAAAVGLEF